MKKKIKKEKDVTCLCHSVVSSFLKRFFFFFFSEHCTEGFLDAQLISMDRTVMPGLEVAPSTSPQVAAQPDENKYYIGSERWNRPDSDQSGHSDFIQSNQSNDRSQVKSQSLIKIIGVLIIIVVLLLAVALGVGLGIGLSAQHKQKSSK